MLLEDAVSQAVARVTGNPILRAIAAEIYAKHVSLQGQKTLPWPHEPDTADQIPGGLADGRSPADFDPDALSAGADVEGEHTSDPAIAREIAMDHLTEDQEYYRRLAVMELRAAFADEFAARGM